MAPAAALMAPALTTVAFTARTFVDFAVAAAPMFSAVETAGPFMAVPPGKMLAAAFVLVTAVPG